MENFRFIAETYCVIKNYYFNSDTREDNPMPKLRLTIVFFYGALMSCSPDQPTVYLPLNPQTDTVVSDNSDETERFNSWLDSQWEAQLSFSPQSQTRLGLKSNYDKLDDYTLEAQNAEIEWLRASIDIMEDMFDYRDLSEEGKLSWYMWNESLTTAENSIPFRNHQYLFGRGGIHTQLPNFLINLHRVDSLKDMEAYVGRLKEIDRVLNEVLLRAQQNAAEGKRQPRFAYDFAVAEIDRILEGSPFSVTDNSPNSPLWRDLQSKIDTLETNGLISSEKAQRLKGEVRAVLTEEVLDAYQDVKAWLIADRNNADSEPKGVWALPNGDAYYNYRLNRMTTLNLSADEIHDIGLIEVARLRSEMETLKDQMGFEGTLQDLFKFIREDPNNYYEATDVGRQNYLDDNYSYLKAINEKLPLYFGRLPKAELEIRRVEAFREQDGAAQHYRPGTPDGSRPGVYYSHMSDMSSLPKHQVEDVLYHEGNPGHHMQISIQQELTDIPKFRTQYFSTAFIEGWGLYAEWLAKEMGGFEDPMSDFGRLSGEIWRAIRLVVDTGIHSKGWSQEEAINYFLQNSDSSEATVKSEIQRYFTSPGQATAYKIGMMNIQQARVYAENTLGDEFDIKEFHDLVLGAGALPLAMLHTRVQNWANKSKESN